MDPDTFRFLDRRNFALAPHIGKGFYHVAPECSFYRRRVFDHCDAHSMNQPNKDTP
jgi:hypothetical protein